MSTKRSKDVAREERPVGRYNLRSAIYRNISPNTSSSSDSNFDDSFEQLCRSLKKKFASSAYSSVGYATANSTSQSVAGESMVEFLTEENKIEAEECDAMDQMFKNIAIRDTSDVVPIEWLEKSESSFSSEITYSHAINNAQLTTVYEDNESNYRSTKSIDSTVISKDSLYNATRHTQASKDSLELYEINSEINTSIEPNDTLEDVEYVHDEQNRYLLKPVSKRSKIPSLSQISPVRSSIDTSVILIDSSPDTSYATARNELKPLGEIKSEISCDGFPVSYSKSEPLTSVDSNRETSVISAISTSNGSFATARDELKTIEVDDIKSEISYATGFDSRISPVRSSIDTSVILIDSSPDTSYATARNELKPLGEIKSEISCDGFPVLYSKSEPLTSVDLNRQTSVISAISTSNGSFATARDELKTIEVDDIKSEISYATGFDSRISYPKTTSFFELETDQSRTTKSNDYFTALSSNQSNSTILSSDSVSSARYNTLDDVSSLISDNSAVSRINRLNFPQADSIDSSKQFNDSIERMEYMMEQGRKIQEKTNAKAAPSNSLAERRTHDSPTSLKRQAPCTKILGSLTKTRIHATPESQRLPTNTKPMIFSSSAKKLISASPASQAITPVSRILKPSNRFPVTKSLSERKYNSPTCSPAFKKPNFPTVEKVWKKESGQSNAASAGRIAQPKNKHFDHIVSPIGAYIKNIAAPPLLANVKPTSDFFDSSYCNKIPKELEYSVVSDNAGRTTTIKPVSSLPMKFFSSAHQQRIVDEKTQKIPGGNKLNRIIGQIPLVIHHEGRIHSGSPQRRIEPVDESVINLSVMSGDISVQVVRDVKRQ